MIFPPPARCINRCNGPLLLAINSSFALKLQFARCLLEQKVRQNGNAPSPQAAQALSEV